jgi:NDP-sugar pyrophosphorylase family protein
VRDVLWPHLDDEERELLPADEPWRALCDLASRLERFWPPDAGPRMVVIDEDADVLGAHIAARRVLVGRGCRIEPGAVLVGEAIVLGPGSTVRAHAYIRGPAYVGRGGLVGHTTELKNAILLAGAKAPHFNYVGDSILGPGVNLGAGTKLSNYRLDGREVRIGWEGSRRSSGMRKLGALIGEGVQTGCNAVLNPGTILGPGCHVAPCATAGGTHLEAGILGHTAPERPAAP